MVSVFTLKKIKIISSIKNLKQSLRLITLIKKEAALPQLGKWGIYISLLNSMIHIFWLRGDHAVRLMLDRNQIPFEESQEVFQPVISSSSHKHVSDKLLHSTSTDGN